VGASSLEIHRLEGRVDGLVAGCRSACFSCGDQGGAAFHLPSATTRLAMVQRSLGRRYVTMDTHREVALFGIMVGSMARTTEFMWIFTLKIARRFDGGDGFYSVCMTNSLRVC
jgi:hypothetical protein